MLVAVNKLKTIYEPRQANLCLRAFRHDKFQLRMPSHSEGPGILTGSAVITHDVTTGTGYCLVGFHWIIDFLN